MVGRLTLCLFLFTLMLSSCREDVDQFIPQKDLPALSVSASLLGRAWSADGAMLEDAEVFFHDRSTLTDAEGLFYFPDAPAPALGALLELRKEGYFPGLRRLYWTSQAQIHADVVLMPQTLAGTVSADAGGEVTCNGGMRLFFPEGAFESEEGDPVTGEARIFAYWLDPSDPAFPGLLPAGAQGEDESGNKRHLQSFGVLAVRMADGNGAPIRLAAGKTMELFFPLPLSLQTGAPDMLYLWSLPAGSGAWKKASPAYLANGHYVAEAATGIFWNVALARPLVQVKSWVQYTGGLPAREVLATATGPDETLLATGRTQNQGLFVLDIPAGVETTIHLFDLCGTERHSQILPPLSGNVSLTPVSWPEAAAVQVQGRLLDCEGIPVAKGYVQVLSGEREALFPLVEGVFSAVLPACAESSGTLIVHDLVRQYQTPPIALNPSGPTDLGDLTLCNDSPEYLSFNLDGELQYGDAPEVLVAGGLTTISEAALGVSFSFEGVDTGTFPVLLPDFAISGLSSSDLSALDLTVSISRFDPPGGFVIGSFLGKAIDLQGQERAISGVFKIKRG